MAGARQGAWVHMGDRGEGQGLGGGGRYRGKGGVAWGGWRSLPFEGDNTHALTVPWVLAGARCLVTVHTRIIFLPPLFSTP
jgi:hypothetical protein